MCWSCKREHLDEKLLLKIKCTFMRHEVMRQRQSLQCAEQGCFIRTKAFDETRRDFGNCLTSRREAQGSTLAYTGADSESGASSAVDSGRLFAVLVGKGEGGGS